jgi:hypothetical protein
MKSEEAPVRIEPRPFVRKSVSRMMNVLEFLQVLEFESISAQGIGRKAQGSLRKTLFGRNAMTCALLRFLCVPWKTLNQSP